MDPIIIIIIIIIIINLPWNKYFALRWWSNTYSRLQGPKELNEKKKYTVLQNAGVVNDAVDGSYCYRWGLNV